MEDERKEREMERMMEMEMEINSRMLRTKNALVKREKNWEGWETCTASQHSTAHHLQQPDCFWGLSSIGRIGLLVWGGSFGSFCAISWKMSLMFSPVLADVSKKIHPFSLA